MSTTTCQYRFSDGKICGEPIERDGAKLYGWRHAAGDVSRQMCHWANPMAYGPEAVGAPRSVQEQRNDFTKRCELEEE